MIEVHQVSHWELQVGSALDPLVEMNQQFHDLLADIFFGTGQFEQDRAQELSNNCLKLVICLCTAHTQKHPFQQACNRRHTMNDLSWANEATV